MKPGKKPNGKSHGKSAAASRIRKLSSASRFSSIWLVLALLIAGVTGYFLISGNAATPPAPTIYLSPATQTLAVSSSFSVQVRENSGTTAVNAVQANFSYPAALVDFVSIDTTGTAFTTDAPSSGGSGQISIARGLVGSVTGDQLIATVNFKTKTTGGSAAMSFTTGTALVNAATNLNILASLSATGGGSYMIDTTPPTVTISAPPSNANLAGGSTVTISITATDADSPVSSVDVYIDGVKITSLFASPYSYSWNTTGVALGSHTISAKATDPFGNVGSSAVISVSLSDQTPPSVSITSPAAGASVAGLVSVNTAAADNAGGSGLAKVEFYVDGTLKATDTLGPYNFSWDSTTATNAAHTLTAKAYDNASPANTATSSGLSVTVDNSPPSQPGNLRATGSTLNSISLAWNASADNVAVTGYRLTRNGTTIATTAGGVLSYTDSGLSAGTGYNYSVAALDAAGNASTAASLSASTLAPKIGDLNGDNLVNAADLSILLFYWNTSTPLADLNGDGTVNVFDLSILLSHWGA